MRIFVDTSAFLAVLNADDEMHSEAKTIWCRELAKNTTLITSNYVLVETTALLQHRLGLQAVRVFEQDVVPVLRIEWVDEDEHRSGIAAVLSADRRKLSLVDCVSFALMRHLAVADCFTFDRHFEEQGFTTLT